MRLPRLPVWRLSLRLAGLCRLRLRLGCGMLRIVGPLPLVLGVDTRPLELLIYMAALAGILLDPGTGRVGPGARPRLDDRGSGAMTIRIVIAPGLII